MKIRVCRKKIYVQFLYAQTKQEICSLTQDYYENKNYEPDHLD